MKKIIVIFYVALVVCFTIFSYLFVDPSLVFMKGIYTGFYTTNRPIVTAIYLLFVFLFYLFYLLFINLVRKKEIELKLLMLIIIVSLTLIFAYPAMLSHDIFNYLTTAKVLFLYQENPYIIMPIEFIGEPFLLFTRAANKIALYGPVWIGLTSIPYLLGFGKFLLILLNFKLLVSFFYLGTIVLLWKISKNLLTVSLFALNPLVIIETLLSGHNDMAMMFLALLSYFFLRKKKFWVGAMFLLISIGIKYATLSLIVIFIYITWKKINDKEVDWNRVFLLSSLAMLLVFFSAPFREEIYPWYAIWFLVFGVFLVQRYNYLLLTYLAFSFGLLLSYIPFMLFGTYSGSTPILKTILMLFPPVVTLSYNLYKEKIWKRQKNYSP